MMLTNNFPYLSRAQLLRPLSETQHEKVLICAKREREGGERRGRTIEQARPQRRQTEQREGNDDMKGEEGKEEIQLLRLLLPQ